MDKRVIALVGFMGTGKTTVGNYLANELQRPFVDLDEQITQLADRSIPEIFAEEGEAGFRQLETRALAELVAHKQPIVLSTGGGVVTQEKNCELLRTHCFTVLLDASVETILARVGDDDSRPLLGNPVGRFERVQALFQARERFYQDVCHVSVKVDGLSVEEVALQIRRHIGTV